MMAIWPTARHAGALPERAPERGFGVNAVL
ncbi:hypothetical protein BVIET440_50312 [Burkholderia vietnamiensis]